ncbi:acyltransferase [Aliagarivorans marinus]|uniref:acyltransferase n=1 Tax=Aliagarivorans marinus TaxID=561965 RepID=UPI000426C16B|nr:acyltransferase [Aliagarivorans marinus]
MLLKILTAFISASLVIANSIPFGSAVTLCGLIKLLLPKGAYPSVTRVANVLMGQWISVNQAIFWLINGSHFEIDDTTQLSRDKWYLVISNHRSWADIVILCMVLAKRTPVPKFFLKQQLLYIPFIGQACWALDMPFMRRYSRSYLLRHPEKHGKDLEATRRACEKFRSVPTTVVNFVEGTRYSHDKQQGSYQHLLPPKALGMAQALSVLGEQFEEVIDVTLCYPGLDESQSPFLALLCGELSSVVVKLDSIPVTQAFRGDYLGDKHYKQHFKRWLEQRWRQKDRYLSRLITLQGQDNQSLTTLISKDEQ